MRAMWKELAVWCSGCSTAGDGRGDAAASTTVPNYLVFAILTTVLCCLPAGIPAIIYAAQVNGKLQAGDLAGAKAASNNAKMWCWLSLGIGLVASLFWLLLFGLGMIRQMGRH